MLLGGILGSMAVGSGFACYKGFQDAKKVTQMRRDFLGKIVEYDKIAEQKDGRFVLSLQNTSDSGLVDLYRQYISTTYKTVPYESAGVGFDFYNLMPTFNVESGYTTQEEQKIKFEHWPFKTLFTQTSFGKQNLIPRGASNFQHHINRESVSPPLKDTTTNGGDIQKALLQDHKLNVPLPSDKIYNYKYFSLKDKPLFFTGSKFGQNYVYDRVATDPEEVAKYEFQAEKDRAESYKYWGGIGAVFLAIFAGASIADR